MQWGDKRRIVELFASEAGDIRCQRRHFQFRYHSAQHWVKVFRDFYGPTHKAFAALDEAGRHRLHASLVELLERHNVAGPASLVVPGEYLEVVVTRG